MGYTNSGATLKWWGPHTKKLKYFSSTKLFKHSNKFGNDGQAVLDVLLGKKFHPSKMKTLSLISPLHQI